MIIMDPYEAGGARVHVTRYLPWRWADARQNRQLQRGFIVVHRALKGAV